MTEDKLKNLREKMIADQIESRGVKDPKVINAIMNVPRHEFVSRALWAQAYSDYPLPIGDDQTISQPYIVALMTELLMLKGDEKVLEIGTGSGYQAAVLARIAKEVYTIEIIDSLAQRARSTLKRLGYKNIKVKSGDGYRGWKEYAPFDGIIITAAPPEIPQPLIDQLKEGGIMVTPIGVYSQELIRAKKVRGVLKKESIIPVRFVPMTGEINKN